MLTSFSAVIASSETWLSSFVLSQSSFISGRRFSTTKYEEEKTGGDCQKILYVPVTRKVSLTGETNQQKMHSGMNQK